MKAAYAVAVERNHESPWLDSGALAGISCDSLSSCDFADDATPSMDLAPE